MSNAPSGTVSEVALTERSCATRRRAVRHSGIATSERRPPKYRLRSRAPAATRVSSAIAMAPVPVPRSQIVTSGGNARALPSARRSTRVSVSGRGTRVAAIELERQAPKLRLAEDAGHRLAITPTLQMAIEGGAFASAGSSSRTARDQRRAVEAGGMRREAAARRARRLSIHRLSSAARPSASASAVRRHAAASSNSESFRAWSSAISASTTSSSASPESTLSSL